jgi:hypothetical protein
MTEAKGRIVEAAFPYFINACSCCMSTEKTQTKSGPEFTLTSSLCRLSPS